VAAFGSGCRVVATEPSADGAPGRQLSGVDRTSTFYSILKASKDCESCDIAPQHSPWTKFEEKVRWREDQSGSHVKVIDMQLFELGA
jgi:hypothetical protein